ncbi:DUF421 domain-containing protein [Paraburkholderia sp.]|jgi:uncharacterized membrane protein YcaP (DUF421 family)|uniref:DUF421 domain-containing protein n=1 Tax=Paraburkholderia sp. TaxID=1926495 RepID=UPI002F3EBEDF
MTQWFTELVGSQGHVTVAQECARATVVFFWGLLLVRVGGRRIFGRWGAIDIVVAIVVGSNLSRAITGNAPFIGTLLATALMIAIHWVLAHLAARYKRLTFITEGNPVHLISRGVPCKRMLQRNGVSANDINEALRQNGIARIEDVGDMTLEPNGKINVSPRPKASSA